MPRVAPRPQALLKCGGEKFFLGPGRRRMEDGGGGGEKFFLGPGRRRMEDGGGGGEKFFLGPGRRRMEDGGWRWWW